MVAAPMGKLLQQGAPEVPGQDICGFLGSLAKLVNFTLNEMGGVKMSNIDLWALVRTCAQTHTHTCACTYAHTFLKYSGNLLIRKIQFERMLHFLHKTEKLIITDKSINICNVPEIYL